jgi:hypothetical protein
MLMDWLTPGTKNLDARRSPAREICPGDERRQGQEGEAAERAFDLRGLRSRRPLQRSRDAPHLRQISPSGKISLFPKGKSPL